MDLLPDALAKEILGHQSGHHMTQHFKAGELVPGWQQGRKVQLPAVISADAIAVVSQFNRELAAFTRKE